MATADILVASEPQLVTQTIIVVSIRRRLRMCLCVRNIDVGSNHVPVQQPMPRRPTSARNQMSVFRFVATRPKLSHAFPIPHGHPLPWKLWPSLRGHGAEAAVSDSRGINGNQRPRRPGNIHSGRGLGRQPRRH